MASPPSIRKDTMTTARVWLRGVFQKTIWSAYNTVNIPLRYQGIYKLLLPLMYGSVAFYGALSFTPPISSIDLVFGFIYGDLWSLAFMVAGLMALVGVCFYARLIWFEVLADVALVTLLGIYAFCILLAGLMQVEPFRITALTVVVMLSLLPAWRVLDMVRELRPPRES